MRILVYPFRCVGNQTRLTQTDPSPRRSHVWALDNPLTMWYTTRVEFNDTHIAAIAAHRSREIT